MTPKIPQNPKISKIQKTSSLCIPKCQFLAKNEEIWTKWRWVLLFRSKFSGLLNPGISHTFCEISRNMSRFRWLVYRGRDNLFQLRKKFLNPHNQNFKSRTKLLKIIFWPWTPPYPLNRSPTPNMLSGISLISCAGLTPWAIQFLVSCFSFGRFRIKEKTDNAMKKTSQKKKSGENLTWPNLNKPATGDFDRTMSLKSQFSGYGPFFKGSQGPHTQNFG